MWPQEGSRRRMSLRTGCTGGATAGAWSGFLRSPTTKGSLHTRGRKKRSPDMSGWTDVTLSVPMPTMARDNGGTPEPLQGSEIRGAGVSHHEDDRYPDPSHSSF